VRDLVIIVVGLIWIVAGGLFVIVAWLTWKFVRSIPRRAEAVTAPAHELIDQAKGVVDTAGEGARTAKDAISFVSDKAVMPTIMFVSLAVGVRRFFETLFAGDRAGGRGGTP
jgi:hypothetical protein